MSAYCLPLVSLALLGATLLVPAAPPPPLTAASLLPVPKTAILRDPDWHIWGASMLRTADGTCHLFVARWPKARTFNAWVSHSEIAYATASDPLGPYVIHGRLFGGGSELNPHVWDAVAHNPCAIEADGRYYIFYSGNTAADGTWWGHRNANRIGVAFADNPAGPWTRLDHPILTTTPGSWDSQVVNSPIVTRGPDGKFYMVYKGVADGKQPAGGNVRMGLAIADHPLGPWRKQPGTFFDAPGVKFPSDDNFIWAQDGVFHAIVKDYGSHFQNRFKEALVLFRSATAREWELEAGDPVLTPFRIAWADGTVTPHVARLDQPQLWRDASGQPAVLFLAVKETGDENNDDVSYNIQVPLRPLETVRRYYQEFAPPASDAPDLVKLIHWAYGYLLLKPASGDPSGDPLPRQIHGQHVEQFAYLLHSWSQVAAWLPEEFRLRCRDFAFDHWESSGLLEVDPLWSAASYNDPLPSEKPVAGAYLHPFKGRHPPGHSIAPNLMMYEVALREGRSDAPRYLAAARSQAQWLVDHLDWSDPRTGKGQRMSEFRTVIGLVWFLQHHAADAPAGLREKVVAWARVAVDHSQNLWDFRRYDLVEHWSIPRLNEPGNLLGFTAAALAASWVIEDPGLRSRLREIAFAQTDAVFGRNPLRAAGVSFAQQGFPEVERGWPIHYKLDTCARLETTRGSISASCGSEFYPYRPDATEFRHAEGWVNYNAAWNVALAYVQFDQAGRRP